MRKVRCDVWDAARFLRDEEDIAAYLEACAEEAGDDPAFLLQALGAVARARSMSALAQQTVLTRAALYQALSATGNPTFATVTKVAAGLGMRVQFAAKRRAPQPTGHHTSTTTIERKTTGTRGAKGGRRRKPHPSV